MLAFCTIIVVRLLEVQLTLQAWILANSVTPFTALIYELDYLRDHFICLIYWE